MIKFRGYGIRPDTYGWVFGKVSTYKKGDKAGEEYLVSPKYYSSIEGCMSRIASTVLRETTEATTLSELADEIRSLQQEIREELSLMHS